MADSALYFPYVEPRRDVALNRVLLYWDQVGTITPEPWEYEDRQIAELFRAGLILPIPPGRYLRRTGYKRFVTGFEPLLDAVMPGRVPIAPVLIHEEKMDHAIRQMFRERGLALDRHVRGSIYVEGNAGALYLAYLAHYLARQPDLEMEPITDQRLLLEAAAGYRPFSVQTAIDGARSSALAGILPAPGDWISVPDLVRFKDRNHEELRALRTEVEQLALLCAREADLEVRRRMESNVADEMVERTDAVRRRMQEQKWPTVDGIMCALAQGAPSVAAGLATHSAAITATGAVPLMVDYLKQNRARRERDLPATYAVLAQDAFDRDPPGRRRPRRRPPAK